MLDRPPEDTGLIPCMAFLHHYVEFQPIMITQCILVFIPSENKQGRGGYVSKKVDRNRGLPMF